MGECASDVSLYRETSTGAPTVAPRTAPVLHRQHRLAQQVRKKKETYLQHHPVGVIDHRQQGKSLMSARHDIEQAAGIRIGMCPNCSQPHLLFLDEDGDIFAEAVISNGIGRELIEGLQSALYADAVNSEDKPWPPDRVS